MVLPNKEGKKHHFCHLTNNKSGNKGTQTLCGSCDCVKVVREGDLSLSFSKTFEEPAIPWGKSNAKKLLYKDIVSGDVPLEQRGSNLTIEDVYCQRPEHAECDVGLFVSQLTSLRNMVRANLKRSNDDPEAFDNFVQNNPMSFDSHKGHIQWQGSESQRPLKNNIQKGLHETQTPLDLWTS